MDCRTPGFSVLHHLLELSQTHVHRVGDAIHPSHSLLSLLLLSSIFPSIRVFSNGSVLRIRWSKYWCFSFNISPSNEYSGLIAFRIDSFEKTLMLWKIEGRRRMGRQRMSWMASPTLWTWVWVSSGSWCWTERPGVLQFMGLQRIRHLRDWTELNIEQKHT